MSRQKKNNKSKLFLPFFIISIMVLSIFGVMIGGISQGEDAVKYNGVYFRSDGGNYLFEKDKIQYRIMNGPSEVEGFYEDIPLNFISDFNSQERVYLDVSDVSSNQLIGNLYSNLARVRPISLACSEGNEHEESCLDKPIKNCENDFLVRFEISDEKEISYNNKCLIVKGSSGYLGGISDVIILSYAGVFYE